tara:strand:+ start:103236 stop:103472 length:237 start_codon:yes stop_codon:yes gene_type:complete
VRIIATLLALIIVGFLISKQLGSGSVQQKQETHAVSDLGAPKVPANPNEVKQFGTQMNSYMKEESEKRAAAIEDAESY